ncbi:MAG: hypothetical protein ACYS0F_08895 [Planctomycetota bacterium]
MHRQNRGHAPEETRTRLEALGNARMRAQNARNGAGDNQLGVRLGEIRELARKLKTDHDLSCRW